jgi:hypothetical protein
MGVTDDRLSHPKLPRPSRPGVGTAGGSAKGARPSIHSPQATPRPLSLYCSPSSMACLEFAICRSPFASSSRRPTRDWVSRGPGDEAPAQGVARSSPQAHPHLVPPTAKVAAVLPLERSAPAVATRHGANAEAGSECRVAEYQTDLAAISSFEIGSPHISNAGAAPRAENHKAVSRPALPPSRARSVGGPLVRSETDLRRCRWCRSWPPDRCCRPTCRP